ncbi:MAG: HypC/HybG/HupF family hydrogenase formation chaperone [Ardenticatenaceae bacterium]|nr:HypC/HybG/HupF family hydrogenase formation chaperone [Ardenticatenaceae bacterium]HBY97208.1 hypothetical protein [Chloroflexota bacterium]
MSAGSDGNSQWSGVSCQWPAGSTAAGTGESYCLTCGDDALPARVLHVDQDLALAVVEIEGQTTEADISLVDGAGIGDIILVHGGVALGRVGEANNEAI